MLLARLQLETETIIGRLKQQQDKLSINFYFHVSHLVLVHQVAAQLWLLLLCLHEQLSALALWSQH